MALSSTAITATGIKAALRKLLRVCRCWLLIAIMVRVALIPVLDPEVLRGTQDRSASAFPVFCWALVLAITGLVTVYAGAGVGSARATLFFS